MTTKKSQLITIDPLNYAEALKRGIIERRELSGLINGFLTNYFTSLENPENAELLTKKQDLEKRRNQLQKEILEVTSEISIISLKIDQKKQEKKQEDKEEYEKIKKMNQSIKNSGLLDEIIPL